MNHLHKFATFNILAMSILCIYPRSSIAQVNDTSAQSDRIIQGKSGGSINSQGCGYIAASPNYQMNLEQRVDYMRLTVKATGGQPTLLVLGPNANDSFCVLGDEISGLQPEISGVWEAGNYQVFVGDRSGSQHQFVLDIAVEN